MRRTLQSRRRWTRSRRSMGGRREQIRRRRFRLAAMLCAIFILFLVLNAHVRPLIGSYGLTQAKLVGTQAINDAVTAVLERDVYKRQDMATVVDSLVAPLSIINALIVAVSLKTVEQNRLMLTELEELWQKYQVYQPFADPAEE